MNLSTAFSNILIYLNILSLSNKDKLIGTYLNTFNNFNVISYLE